jgi:hypothetical protein
MQVRLEATCGCGSRRYKKKGTAISVFEKNCPAADSSEAVQREYQCSQLVMVIVFLDCLEDFVKTETLPQRKSERTTQYRAAKTIGADTLENTKTLKDSTRRTFLKAVGGGIPSLALIAHGSVVASNQGPGLPAETANWKFTPIDLAPYFNASPPDFGPRKNAKRMRGPSSKDGLLRMPAGNLTLRGIPYKLGPEAIDKKSWVVLSTRMTPWTSKQLEIPLGQRAEFICLASFCDWDEHESPAPGLDVAERVGQHLADAALVYEDGSEETFRIRRRFEVNSPSYVWGHLSYASVPHTPDTPRMLHDALPDATDWGFLQTVSGEGAYSPRSGGTLWICALENPSRERVVKTLRIEAKQEDLLAICGLTLFHGHQNPLRYERLCLYRIRLPEGTADDLAQWKVSVDLGVVARTYFLNEFDASRWLSAAVKGLGEQNQKQGERQFLYAEVTASPDATLSIIDAKVAKRYEFDLGQVVAGKELEARPPGPKVEVIETEKVWLHGQAVESATGRPTPVRLAFRSKDGRYIPPYGHRTEINDSWFQDYGADLKLMDSSFAYVDGTFQVELPVGDVYLEMTKGFEYEPVRKKLDIQSKQTKLDLEISRIMDFRSRGWVTADTHVHFLSPSTAVLEGQAEGLNLINLLAAQWGDLFTNVGDLSHGPLTSRDGQTLVQLGTENRQHILGHLSLLGTQTAPAFPMSASGPGESYLGDPLWSCLADWADACREREGLAVAPHFPYPTAELAATIALGKIDAVEVRGQVSSPLAFNELSFLDWYRYLNCGYRLPCVGGTDKMFAWMPVGFQRTYAYLGQEVFNFSNWSKAVRHGNTFMTSGPLLLFQADSHMPGDEILVGAGGGVVEVGVEAKSFVPFHRLEVVMNGRVVASRDDEAGTRQMTLRDKVQIGESAWIAARCASKFGPVTPWQLKICAHTSPVYVRMHGQDVFSAPGLTYMLTLIEGAQTWVEQLATRPDPDRFAHTLKTFADAREALHYRLHRHGMKH